MSEQYCANCKFYTEIRHRGQKYPKGKCEQHIATRITDGYQIHLSLSSPYEYICDLYEQRPKPTYALVNDDIILIPPIIAKDLQAQGWVIAEIDNEKRLTKPTMSKTAT